MKTRLLFFLTLYSFFNLQAQNQTLDWANVRVNFNQAVADNNNIYYNFNADDFSTVYYSNGGYSTSGISGTAVYNSELRPYVQIGLGPSLRIVDIEILLNTSSTFPCIFTPTYEGETVATTADAISANLGGNAQTVSLNWSRKVSLLEISVQGISGITFVVGNINVELPPNIIYVNQNATGTNTGDSWANAYTDLQPALDAAVANDEVWVASGTYLPTESPDETTNINRNKAFHFNKDIKLYGGFAGTETTIEERTTNNETILSGSIGNSSQTADDAYHVMITSALSNNALIDSFTIKNGNANSNATITYGAGGFFQDNGAGLANSSSSPTLNKVNFVNNTASGEGGAIYNVYSAPIIKNAIFDGNTSGSYGGAIYNDQTSSPEISNSLFHNNTATTGGGAIFNGNFSSPTITNATFTKNKSTNDTYLGGGGAIFNYYFSYPTLYNLAFWENTAGNSSNDVDSYSNANTAITAVSIASDNTNTPGFSSRIYVDPFVNSLDVNGADNIYGTSDDGFVPAFTPSNSALVPLKDKGTNSYNSESNDLADNDRIINSTIDIGAYEYVLPTTSTLNFTATNGTVTTDIQPTNGTYAIGTVVEITAVPDAGYLFDGWSGDLNGPTNPFSITMDADKNITASFSAIQHTLTTAATNGTVAVDIQPTNGTYDYGTVVTLTATPDAGYQFDGWNGDTTFTTNPLPITLDTDKSLTALFSLAATASITDNEFNSAVKLYPNPVVNSLKVDLGSGNTLKNIEVFSVLGKKVASSITNSVSLTKLSSGIYMLKVENTEGKISIKKIIKK